MGDKVCALCGGTGHTASHCPWQTAQNSLDAAKDERYSRAIHTLRALCHDKRNGSFDHRGGLETGRPPFPLARPLRSSFCAGLVALAVRGLPEESFLPSADGASWPCVKQPSVAQTAETQISFLSELRTQSSAPTATTLTLTALALSEKSIGTLKKVRLPFTVAP